jgi:sugar/nucleoside kinase (ribokinase family)
VITLNKKKLITITGTILINKDVETVFNFFADPGNDAQWRAEVNESTLDGNLEMGVTVFEHSYLSKKAPNNLIELKCIEFKRNKIAIFETEPNAKFYERSQRQVNVVSGSTTEITYSLDFDIEIVKFALGFSLPKFIVSMKAGSDMKKYLRNLKKQLEIN